LSSPTNYHRRRTHRPVDSGVRKRIGTGSRTIHRWKIFRCR
jgi:hypothetical protein